MSDATLEMLLRAPRKMIANAQWRHHERDTERKLPTVQGCAN